MTRPAAHHDSHRPGSRPPGPPPPGTGAPPPPALPASQLAAAVACLDDPFVLTGSSPENRFEIEYVNEAFAGLAGRPAAALRGLALGRLLADLGGDDAEAHLHEAARGRLTAVLGVFSMPGRRARREFELTAYSLDDSPMQSRHAFILRDVTDLTRERRTSDRDRKRLEGLVQERTAKLEEFHERLRLTERLASIGTLGAGLCHDMNNLLMPIRGHLDAMEAAGLDADQSEHLWSVREAVDYLQQLTNALHLFALDPDDPGAGPGVTDVVEWWGQLRPLLARTIPAHIKLEVDLPDGLPPVAVTVHRLTQAALNLIINAVDAIEGPGVIRLWAQATEDRRFVRLGVTDNGRGMSQEAQRHALEPFFTTKTRSRSTGLGLSLVHGVVHGAGGGVDIQSQLGQGTTVTLNLPSVAADHTRDGREDATGGLAVVTVADTRISACFMSFLRSAGFAVEAPGHGELDGAAVWVTDASARALARARRLEQANPACRVVAYGRRSTAWDDLGATIIDSREGLEGIRGGIERLILAAEER